MHRLDFAGQEWRLLDSGGLFWPARQTLLVADLHLEKGSWFATRGQYLPPFDSRATLTRLHQDVARTGARQLWCLGDNFHDCHGPQRLEPAARALLQQLGDQVGLCWVTGNHDRSSATAQGLPGMAADELHESGLIFRHEALAGERGFEFSGHFHPKLRVRTKARTISRPCFARFGRRLILPAYGALTGGLDVLEPAFNPLRSGDDEALLAAGRRLLRVPL